MKRSSLKKILWTLVVVVLILGAAVGGSILFKLSQTEPIKVGILHSLTGGLAITEKPIVDATLMAIDEINSKGGLLGRKLIPIVMDGKSSDAAFKKAALQLIEHDKVAVIFGPWRSTTRQMLKKIVEQHDIFMFYPAVDEGLEESQNIIYTGSMPNQVILPGIAWCFKNLGKKFFLVGSDNIFPRVINEIAQLHVASLGGTVVGSEFVESAKEIDAVIAKIVTSKPQVILNTLDAAMNIPFFKALRAAGIRPENIPTMSFSFAEGELQHLEIPYMVGDYAAGTYFQKIYRDENIRFIKNFKKRYGADSVIGDSMEAGYANVYLWAQSVRQAGSITTALVRPYLQRQVFDAPGGILYLDSTQHAWRLAFIGKIKYDGQFLIVWNSKKQIKPEIYPPYKDKKYWLDFVKSLKKKGSVNE